MSQFNLTVTRTPKSLIYRIRRNSFVRFTILTESGRLEFEEFVTLAAKFIVEEDAEALEKELREAFRLYDKEGEKKGMMKKTFVNSLSQK